jgi:hypothetical protein
VTPADRATVLRMLAASAGSRLVEGGDFVFDDSDCTLYKLGDGRKSWRPLERNGKGQPWRPICPPLVSPDQRSMAVAARRGAAAAKTGASGEVIDLWWIEVVPARK